MLFLLRPRQTWMPYALPRSAPQQNVYIEQLHKAYSSTRRVDPATPSTVPDPLTAVMDLGELHQKGLLTDDEFAAAKAKVLADPGDSP